MKFLFKYLTLASGCILCFFAIMFAIENIGKKVVEPLASEELYTVEYSNEIIGYNDVIPLKIVMENGIISRVEILDNRETPKYLSKVINGGIPERFTGMTPKEVVDTDFDAISGATFSSNAIIKSVKATMAAYEESHNPTIWGWQLIGVICSAICVVICSSILSRLRRQK